MRSISLFPDIDSFLVFSDPFFHQGNKRGQSNLSNNFNAALTEQVFSPATDLSETDKEIKVTCNVPGMKKDKLKIEIDEEHHTLTLSGTIEKEKKEENKSFMLLRDHLDHLLELSNCQEMPIWKMSRQIWKMVF